MLAAGNGHAALLPWLLERGAALGARDEEGFTAFLWACAKGDLGCAGALLGAGCSAAAMTLQGETARELAVLDGHDALAAWLDAVEGFTPLHWACNSREPARVLAALRGDDVHDVSARCGAGSAGPTALDITTRPEAFPHVPSLVCAGTAALVRAALAPWSTSTHRVQTAAFRRAVHAVLCVSVRLRGAADPHRLVPPLPLLPTEAWLAVLQHCSRDWW